ncbi:MAG: ornithine carbamoyltransferase [Firmicutes bacterium]|jgi:ornithine carbamoyltransferase|nr:ornithine carbamoyltransferase [Bacillota bacterium]
MSEAMRLLYDSVGRGLSGKDLISVHDLSQDEVKRVMDLSAVLKAEQKAGVPHPILRGKTLAMIFQKPSTRTRVSFETAIWQLGGYGLFLNANDLQLRRGETVSDTARVLSRYVDGIMIRTYAHADVVELAEGASVPVINGLTDLLHPCQALADVFTVFEWKGDPRGRKLTFVGDGNNVAHSLMFTCAKVGMSVTVGCPPGYEPDPAVLDAARSDARATGAEIEVTNDPVEAVREADVLYTDVWASMGQEAEHAERVEAMKPYQLNAALLSKAKPDCMVMHCLPAHRGEEITDEVADGPQSAIWDEAENRMHVQKAILALLMS